MQSKGKFVAKPSAILLVLWVGVAWGRNHALKALGDRFLDLPAVCSGRLTLTSGTAITTSNVTGASTIYFTPYLGAKISLYNGSNWELFSFSELSLALSALTSDRNYDIFVYSNSGTPALELSAAWAADGTTRTDAITIQDGIYVKSGAATRRYVGTMHTTSTTTTEDSHARRYLWNRCNPVTRRMLGNMTVSSWSYINKVSWRPSGGVSTDGTSRVAFVVGLASEATATAYQLADASANAFPNITIGLDRTSNDDSTGRGAPDKVSTRFYMDTMFTGTVAAGSHYFQVLELASGGGATTPVFYGLFGAYFHSIYAQISG